MEIGMKEVVIGLLVLAGFIVALVLRIISQYLKDTNLGMGQLSGREPEEAEEEEEMDSDTRYMVRIMVADISYIDTDKECGVSFALKGVPGIYTLMWDEEKNVVKAYEAILRAMDKGDKFIDIECESTDYNN